MYLANLDLASTLTPLLGWNAGCITIGGVNVRKED